MLRFVPLSLSLFATLLLAACATAVRPAAPAVSTTPRDVGIDETALQPTVNPCSDFYQFACGGWLDRTAIPEDKPQWSRSFSELRERSQAELRRILDDPGTTGKLADFWASCMDEAKIEAQGTAPLVPLLQEIDSVGSTAGLGRLFARLHRRGVGAGFEVGSQQDFKDSTQVIAVVDQGGLGLPDRDYYLKDDARSKELRVRYEEHVRKMFELLGVKPGQAGAYAGLVLRLETDLARASLSLVDRRDPAKIYHRLELVGLKQAAPRLQWDAYFAELGRPDVTALNVTAPAFFKALSEALARRPVSEWKVYLKWHLLSQVAPQLPKAFVDESFRFHGQVLQGIAANQPRWKRCLEQTDAALGELLAQPFVARTFGREGKETVLDMVRRIEETMRQTLSGLSWMDSATRHAAEGKLGKVRNKIGFPDAWRSYDALSIGRDSHLANVLAGRDFELRRQLAKIGKPVDRGEWLMTPPTVNAYYEASLNEMVFPAGILQPPFFSRTAHPAVNYGGIGMVMGHELTHGFDDEGRKFDGDGNMTDWWSPNVGGEFERRTECVVKQYAAYVAVDDVHLDGKLTLGENIADLGGLRLALQAYRATRAASAVASAVPGSHFTDEQLFFLGYAQSWCTKRRDAFSRMMAAVDPHSPPSFRVNGAVSNMPDFAAAFQCQPGAPMRRQDPCAVW